MRAIVYGLGATGGTLAARLAQTGTEVIGIARGSMLDAIRAQGGLNFLSHHGRGVARFPVVASPNDVDWRPDDFILLTMKSNDTAAALDALAAAGVTHQPVVCAQNGVANERMALRRFPNVFGMVVMMPTQFIVPGTVAAMGTPTLGILDIGRASPGDNGMILPLAAALSQAGFLCDPTSDVMAGKYGKLLMNLGNIVGAALGIGARNGPWYDRVKEEGIAVLNAAGIISEDVGQADPRRRHMQRVPLDGVEEVGTSSMQSLIRGTGSIETDFLNGEIALLGRLHGVPTPANAAFQLVARRMVRDRMLPGSFPEEEIRRLSMAG
jgi:2-dehydropantoate 2-reductase